MIYILMPIFALLIAIGVFTLYIIASEFKPSPIEKSEIIRNSRDEKQNDILTVTSFNLGYCSLDKEQDFFLEGGTNTKRISRDNTFDNLISLTGIIKDLNSNNFNE